VDTNARFPCFKPLPCSICAALAISSSGVAGEPWNRGFDSSVSRRNHAGSTNSNPCAEIEHATPLEDDEGRLDASYDDEPLRYRTMENILGDDSPPG